MDQKIVDAIKNRHESNLELLGYLKDFIDKYPEIRFGQALVCLNILEYGEHGIIDPFNIESTVMLKHVKSSIQS